MHLKPCFHLCSPLQSYCSDPSLVLDLKNLIVLFADTLQVRGAWASPHPGCPVVLQGLSWAGQAPFWAFLGVDHPMDIWVWSVHGPSLGHLTQPLGFESSGSFSPSLSHP